MTSLVDRLRQQDPDLLEMRLVEIPQAYSSSISELIDAMKGNTTVEYLRVDRDFLPGIESAADTEDFFSAVAHLSKLVDAHIWHGSIPVKALAEFIKGSKGLENLQLGCIDLEGSEQDFATVAAALEGHPSLKVFALTDFSLNDETVAIDGLIETLSRLPKLEQVKLEVTNQRRSSIVGNERAASKVKVSISGASLCSLLGSNTLQDLFLSRLNLSREDFIVLSSAIKTAPSLKSFAIPHCHLDDEGCSAVAVAIAANATLEKVDLSCNNLTDEGCIEIATALKNDESVKFLRLWGNVKISNAGFDALVDMLQTNCVLERVPLMAPLEYQNKIDAAMVKNRKTTNRAA